VDLDAPKVVMTTHNGITLHGDDPPPNHFQIGFGQHFVLRKTSQVPSGLAEHYKVPKLIWIDIVPITEWNTSGETSMEDARCAYLREALGAVPGRRFTTEQLAEYLVEWDRRIFGGRGAFDENLEADRVAKAKKIGFLNNGRYRPKDRPAFGEFFEDRVYSGGTRVTHEWRAPDITW
jgi:hypothetical protein